MRMHFTRSLPAAVFLIAAVLPAQRTFTLQNSRLSAKFVSADGALKFSSITDLETRATLNPAEVFSLQLRDGSVIKASDLKLATPPAYKNIFAIPAASREAEHIAARELCADLSARDKSFTVHWCAVLRGNTNYLRQEVTLIAAAKPVDIAQVRLVDYPSATAQVVGKVPGSPIVDGNFFLGFEFPLSASTVSNGNATSLLARTLPLAPQQSITYSSVIGIAAPGQMRREFLGYLENERAHPYRTFLHYNTWYDTGNTADETRSLDRIHVIGEELVRKRQVKMDSFLFDDGWDDTHTVWKFNSRFPDGFSTIATAAAKYNFKIGVWLSPWGGYGQDKKDRIAAGEKEGYEIIKGGFALSGPKYYDRFEQTCLDMIKNYGVNQFKFDGTGNVSSVFPGSLFDSDFSAAIHLIGRLREQEPDIYINLTTGTLPSPFWLRYADSIWRGGGDHDFDGVGTWRQKWITYRDEQTYRNIVLGGPLFPLSSLMQHGIIYGDRANHLTTDPGHDFPDEVHAYFANGTQLQELYITPSLLTSADWDNIAEGARWSRANAATLKDTHWIGGDPGKLEVYGWAAWSAKKSIITLRNPSDKAQQYTLNIATALELPVGSAQNYTVANVWDKNSASKLLPAKLRASTSITLTLQPFQIQTYEFTPKK